MNKSPYDNLTPVTIDEVPHYVDVEIEDTPEEVITPEKPSGKTVALTGAPRYTTLPIKNRKKSTEYILPFEDTLLVPDTMPDMAEILFAEGNIQLSGNRKYSNNDIVSGNITFYTIYRPEISKNQPAEIIKSSIPFKSHDMWSDSESSSYRIKATLRNLTCEKYNERKFLAKGEIVFTITEIAQFQLTIFKGLDDTQFICRNETIKLTDLCFEKEETSEISQEVNMNSDEPSPVKILKESVETVEIHKQITSGKLVINAAIISRILYNGETDGEMQLCSRTLKTEFTQFIPVKDDLDPALISIDFDDSDIHVSVASNRQFLLHGQVTTIVCGYCHQEVTMVSDAYHKTYETAFDVEETLLNDAKGTVSGEISSREVISINENEYTPAQLLTGCCTSVDITVRPDGSRLIIDGSIPVKILALTSDSVPFAIDCVVPMRGALELPDGCQNCKVDFTCIIRDFWFSEINSRQLEVNISAFITVWLDNESKFVTLQNISLHETDDTIYQYSISLHTISDSETLWNIAKRYKGNVDDIARLNNIDSSHQLCSGSKILIMK